MNVSRFLIFANESAKPNPAGELSPCWANEFREDGEHTIVQLSPFGIFPNVQGLQIFTPKDAANVAGDLIANAKMKLGPGLPWFIGHPDHPLHRERYKDGQAYGRIKGLECRADSNCAACNTFMVNSQNGHEPCREHGLFARVKFNESGKKLIANEAFDGHSTNWRLRKGKDGWHPFSLKSVGFTNEPNIPVPAITSANETLDCEWANDVELTKAHFTKLAGLRLMANVDVSTGRPFQGNQHVGGYEHAAGKAHLATVAAHKQGTFAAHTEAANAHALARDMADESIKPTHEAMRSQHSGLAEKVSKNVKGNSRFRALAKMRK